MTGRAILVAVSLGALGGSLAAVFAVGTNRPQQPQTALAVRGTSRLLDDDGWRRTADGWEDRRSWAADGAAVAHRGVAWSSAAVPRQKEISAWGQTHPAAVALGQWMLSLWGLSAAQQRGAPTYWRSWRAALAASFRASAFY